MKRRLLTTICAALAAPWAFATPSGLNNIPTAGLGFLYALHENVVLESWASQPFDDGDTIYTVKLNFVFKF